jgi:protein TonB
LKSHAAAVRRQKPPALPPVARLQTPLAEDPTRHRPAPRQPSTQWQQVIAPPAPASPPGEQDPLATYLAEVRAAIDRHKRYPSAARRAGITGSVVLQFVILPDGRVIEPSVAETNGHSAFGAAALDSLRRASPMPPFPEEIARDRLMVRVPISYKLTE